VKHFDNVKKEGHIPGTSSRHDACRAVEQMRLQQPGRCALINSHGKSTESWINMNSLRYIVTTSQNMRTVNGVRLHRLTLHLDTAGTVDALASEVRSKRRGQLDVCGGNLNGHTSSVHGSHALADVLHTLGRYVGSGGLERSPAAIVLDNWSNSGREEDIHDSGCDSVDSDASRSLLLGECASEGDDSALGGAVVDL
jgi:hypothetical protein